METGFPIEALSLITRVLFSHKIDPRACGYLPISSTTFFNTPGLFE